MNSNIFRREVMESDITANNEEKHIHHNYYSSYNRILVFVSINHFFVMIDDSIMGGIGPIFFEIIYNSAERCVFSNIIKRMIT